MMRAKIFLGVTTLAIGGLVMTLQPRPERPDNPAPRFDDPHAAARADLERRQPANRGLDMPRLYDAATRRVASLDRFSSAIGRDIPASQPASRLWLSGSRVTLLGNTSRATGVLDAWTPLGPGNIGGRTRVVRFHPTVPTTLFAAGVSGGIWRSDDSGASWQPTGDGLTNIAVNSLLIDPANPNVMYAGTGEGYFREEIRGTGLPLRGSGIYVTVDGAATWQQLPATNTPDFHWVNDLEFGVTDSRRIYAATRSGVWRSTDGGATWEQMLAANVRGGCLDLALRPDKPQDVLFASCGSYEQATVYRFPRAAYRFDSQVVLRQPDMGRTSLAIAPSHPDVVYALAASNAPGPQGIYQQGLLAVYRSERGGLPGSWQTRVSNTDQTFLNTLLLTNTASAAPRVCGAGANVMPSTMGWYNNVIAVDPRDPNRVWAAGVDWFRSDDGGRNWGLASFANPNLPAFTHVDQHAITFHPQYDGAGNQIVLIGNDGGVFRSTNARAATSKGPNAVCAGGFPIFVAWSSLNRGYGVTQFYHGTPFPDGTQYIGGTQDNGTLLGSDTAGPDGWKGVFGGDGGYTAVHPAQTGTWLVETQWTGNLARTTNSGATFFQSRTGLDPVVASGLGPQGNFLFIPPFTHDPVSNAIWLGGQFLYRGGNFGQSWGKVLSSQAPAGGRVSAITVSPRANGTVFAGTDQGHILRTVNGMEAPEAIVFTTTQPRHGWVTSIAVDAESGAVYATYGNFGGAHVFRSTDNGATWHSLDGSGPDGLPDIPVHSIVVDPDDRRRLYLGTDLGVMVSIDGGATWMSEETGFGPAVTMWLSMIRTPSGRKQLFAFTHGRGVWRVTLR